MVRHRAGSALDLSAHRALARADGVHRLRPRHRRLVGRILHATGALVGRVAHGLGGAAERRAPLIGGVLRGDRRGLERLDRLDGVVARVGDHRLVVGAGMVRRFLQGGAGVTLEFVPVDHHILNARGRDALDRVVRLLGPDLRVLELLPVVRCPALNVRDRDLGGGLTARLDDVVELFVQRRGFRRRRAVQFLLLGVRRQGILRRRALASLTS